MMRSLAILGILFLTACVPPVEIQPLAVEASIEPFEEDKAMMIQPIAEYDHYVFNDETRALAGVGVDKLESVAVLDDQGQEWKPDAFCVIDGSAFMSFSWMEDDGNGNAISAHSYFKQTGDIISELVEADFPTVPSSIRITIDDDPFSVTKDKYGDMDISTVRRGTQAEAYLMIDGAVRTSAGLFFSVFETYHTRERGVYLWQETGSKIKLSGVGRIW